MPIASFALVNSAVAGDQAALERLLVLSQPDLQRYARRLCQSEDVEEAVQDALWLLYSRLGALRTVAAFSGWLFQMVRRVCWSLARRRGAADRHVELSPDIADPASRDDPALRLDLVRALTRLNPGYRQVLLLRDVWGASAEETAELSGISVAAAKSRLHRARAQMRELLGADAMIIESARA